VSRGPTSSGFGKIERGISDGWIVKMLPGCEVGLFSNDKLVRRATDEEVESARSELFYKRHAVSEPEPPRLSNRSEPSKRYEPKAPPVTEDYLTWTRSETAKPRTPADEAAWQLHEEDRRARVNAEVAAAARLQAGIDAYERVRKADEDRSVLIEHCLDFPTSESPKPCGDC
jgi:hypothetical protein